MNNSFIKGRNWNVCSVHIDPMKFVVIFWPDCFLNEGSWTLPLIDPVKFAKYVSVWLNRTDWIFQLTEQSVIFIVELERENVLKGIEWDIWVFGCCRGSLVVVEDLWVLCCCSGYLSIVLLLWISWVLFWCRGSLAVVLLYRISSCVVV